MTKERFNEDDLPDSTGYVEAGRQLGQLGMEVGRAIGRGALTGMQDGLRRVVETVSQPFETDHAALERQVLAEQPQQFVGEMYQAIAEGDPELAEQAGALAIRAVTHARESGQLAPEAVNRLQADVAYDTQHVDHLLSEGDEGNPLLQQPDTQAADNLLQ